MNEIELEQKVYDNAKRLISGIGQFHWRSTDDVNATFLSDGKHFHYSESGDATYHTAILLSIMAFRYRYIQDDKQKKDTLKTINRLVEYLEFSQLVGQGMFCRYFALEKAYDKFPPMHKAGNADFSLKDKSGGHMRYVECVGKDGKTYMGRYDISADPVLKSFIALYWVQKFIPDMRNRVVEIVQGVMDYYEKNNWRIKDRNTGKLLRYGIHNPYFFNLFCSSVRIIGETILSERLQKGFYYSVCMWFNNRMRTWIPGIYRSKKTRNAFNNYAISSAFSTLLDMGYDVKKGLNRMIKETEGENNYFSHALHNWFNGTKKETMPVTDEMIQKNHPVGNINVGITVPFNKRVGYNFWEVNPYSSALTEKKSVNGWLGNEAFLQAYWYSKHSIIH